MAIAAVLAATTPECSTYFFIVSWRISPNIFSDESIFSTFSFKSLITTCCSASWSATAFFTFTMLDRMSAENFSTSPTCESMLPCTATAISAMTRLCSVISSFCCSSNFLTAARNVPAASAPSSHFVPTSELSSSLHSFSAAAAPPAISCNWPNSSPCWSSSWVTVSASCDSWSARCSSCPASCSFMTRQLASCCSRYCWMTDRMLSALASKFSWKLSQTFSLVSSTVLFLSSLSWSRFTSWVVSSLTTRSFLACCPSLASVSTCFSTKCFCSSLSVAVFCRTVLVQVSVCSVSNSLTLVDSSCLFLVSSSCSHSSNNSCFFSISSFRALMFPICSEISWL